MTRILFSIAALLVAAGRLGASEPRQLRLDDVFALRTVADPQLSPDGRWVAYTIARLDAAKDTTDTDVYMVAFEGGEPVRLTTSARSETSPRWSPDGRFLAFLSSRGDGDEDGDQDGDEAKSQVFLLDRRGGEAVRLTDFEADVDALAWSPDGQRLALVVWDVDPDARKKAGAQGEQTAPPIVIRRLQFKEDGIGYLREPRRHLYVFDVASKVARQITSGPYDDGEPAWSPDGKWIAFTSKRGEEPDATQNADVFVVSADGGEPRRLTSSPGYDSAPAFSPDGARVAYLAGNHPKDLWYGTTHLAVVAAHGGEPRALTAALDRNVFDPRFGADGRALYVRLEDAGTVQLARVNVATGAIEQLVVGEREVEAFDLGARGELVVLETDPQRPAELSAVEARGALRRLTRTNDALLEGIRLARVERFRATSRDGTPVDAFLTIPPDARPGERLPTVLRIHGGPVAQYASAFDLEWQLLAAHGYAVVAANPRGSSGHGTDFSRAIWADWGNKDFEDVMAAVDHAIESGVADPERLGVGGWSYGGILTNYVITKTGRFKAAVTGASETNYLSNYGTDHYQYWWETELGLPWRTTELWIRISPFFQVEEITTPTLLLCGEDDVNVPLLNSEQLYQALRRLGRVDTELVIYPGQSHSIVKPSYQRDRLERYLAWYGRYLRPRGGSAEAVSLLGRVLYAPEPEAGSLTALDKTLAEARSAHELAPADADKAIALGRALSAHGRYRDAVDVYSRAIESTPEDFRLYRHRGHRYVTLRRFDAALADLEQGAALVRRAAEAGEPKERFDVFYHLGLVRYLRGEYAEALSAYEECLRLAGVDADNIVAASDWLYATLRRLGRDAEAARVLEPIHAELEVKDNRVYLDRLLMYKGLDSPESLLAAGTDGIGRATYGYGVANFLLLQGELQRGARALHGVVAGEAWIAFGYIAAEAELARRR